MTAEQSRFYQVSERIFRRIIDFYERTLDWVLERRGLTLAVAVGTLVLTILLYLLVPKGFFPVQDTGEIQGVSEAGQTVSFSQMAQLQQRLAAAILQNPAVESLSSFIGVDGTNTTLNSGRIQINLKPLSKRKSATDVIRELQSAAKRRGWHQSVHAAHSGHHGRGYRQPDRIPIQHAGSRVRTSWRSMQGASSNACSSCPSSRMSRATCKTAAARSRCSSTAPRRRVSASRRRTSTTRCTTASASVRSRRCSRS